MTLVNSEGHFLVLTQVAESLLAFLMANALNTSAAQGKAVSRGAAKGVHSNDILFVFAQAFLWARARPG
jgi:hypothetical protein